MPTPSWTWAIDDEMVVLQMEQVSGVSGNLLFFKLALRYVGVNTWKPVFVNDNGEVDYPSINLATSNWHVDVAMGTSNADMQQVIRLIVNNVAGTNKAFLVMAEAWDFTQNIRLRMFAAAEVSPWYFNGAIGRIDYVGGYFSTAGSTTNEENTLERKIPFIEYWLDFQDPMYSQYFKNRANTSYTAAINGYSNHSDFQDIQFDFKDGWVNRKNMLLIQFPQFTWNEDMDINNIWYFKMKFRHVNHWSQQGERFKFYDYGNPASPYFSVYIYKWDYGTPVRVRTVFPGQGDWDTCYYTISPANELGESVETAYGQAVFRPTYSRTQINYRYTCSITGLGSSRTLSAGYSTVTNPVISFGGYEVYHQQEPNIPASTYSAYPRSPFLQPAGTTNRRNAMIQFILREFVYATGTGHSSSTMMTSASNCKPNSLLLLGFDEVDMPLACSAGYNNYHEVGLCIQDPLVAGSTDCSHDMNSVGSNCFRCPRNFGKTGTDACSQCFSNCLMCTGPNSDQCTYCGLGYGFTGVSCTKCGSDQTWDLTKNLCQLKKALYLEMDFELSSFGQVQLYFLPLDGYADLSLYYEYLYDKFWLIDINFNYEFSRYYDNLPLHRKVSISFELMCIDTRTFDPVAWSVDGIYLGFLNWALEDQGMNVTTTSFWGYGYLDQLPTKYSHTIMHSANTMRFIVKPFFTYDWQTLWIRELNVTFFGCFESCKTCWEDNSPVHCLSCLDGYYFTNFQCKACSASCKTCAGDPFSCTSCPSTQKLLGGSCIAACGLGFYADGTGTCQACPATCVQCNSFTNCISCINGYFLDGTNMCSACDNTQCQNCIGTATTCTSCSGTKLLQSSTCIPAVPGCSAGFYQVGTTSCQPCPTGCATCSTTTCTSCQGGYIPKGTICALSTDCGAGWYNAGASCQQCLSVCQTCTTGTTCTTCKPGYVGASCSPCTAPCLTCAGTSTSCTSCYPSSTKYLQLGGGSCVDADQCSAGSYAETNNQCMACSSDCATCKDFPDKCLTCADATKTWSNFKCIGSCGTGLTAMGGLCCPSMCTGCDITMACSGCITGFYLDGSSNCISCDSSCLTCLGTATKCTSCPVGKVLQGSVCQDSCNSNFYLDGSVCKICHSSCGTCNGPANTQCLTCADRHVPWKNLCWSCLATQPNYDKSRFEEKGGRCWEKCGIAGKLTIDDIAEGLGGYKACDDGNQINGDGCSASCVVEKNYNCVGGSENQRDYCYPLAKPIAELYPINNSTEFQISFSKKIQFRNVSDTKNNTNIPVPISIEFAGVSSSLFTVTWTKPNSAEFDYINFTIVAQESIVNGRLTATFERSLITDNFNNTLSTVKLRANTTINVEKSFFFETVYSGMQVTNKIFNVVVPVSSLGITNYILQSFIRYMTTFQIIGAGIFYNVNQTSTVTNLLKQASLLTSKTLPGPTEMMKSKLVVMNTSLSLSPNIKTSLSRLLEESAASNSSAYSKMFDLSDSPLPMKRNGYTVSLIPNLSFSIVAILVTGVWYLTVSYCLFGKVTVRDGFLKKFAAFSAERSFYTSMMLGALELSFFSTFNVFNPKFDHIANMLSFIVSALVLVSVLMLPGILYKMADRLITTLWHPEYYERYGFVYCEFKLSTTASKSFMAIIMTRIVLFGFTAAALMNVPVGQTVCLFILHGVYLVVLVKVKPFVSMVMHIITILAEVCILGSSFCFMASAFDNQKNMLSLAQKEKLDLANCVLIMLAVIFTLVGTLMMIILKIIQFVRKSADKKKLDQIMPVNSAKKMVGAANPELESVKSERTVLKSQKGDSKQVPIGKEMEDRVEGPKQPSPGKSALRLPISNVSNKQSTPMLDDDFFGQGQGQGQQGGTKRSVGVKKEEFEEDFFGGSKPTQKVRINQNQPQRGDSDDDDKF